MILISKYSTSFAEHFIIFKFPKFSQLKKYYSELPGKQVLNPPQERKSKAQLKHIELEQNNPQQTSPMIPQSPSSFPSIIPIDSLQIGILLLNSSVVEIMERTNRTPNTNRGHSSRKLAPRTQILQQSQSQKRRIRILSFLPCHPFIFPSYDSPHLPCHPFIFRSYDSPHLPCSNIDASPSHNRKKTTLHHRNISECRQT